MGSYFEFQDNYHQWYRKVRGCISSDWWPYVDPEKDMVFKRPSFRLIPTSHQHSEDPEYEIGPPDDTPGLDGLEWAQYNGKKALYYQ